MFKTIKIHRDLADQMDHVKGKETYSAYLNLMLTYFRVTGIHPRSVQKHPMEDISKGFDRVIALIKSMEKTKFTPILDTVKQLQFTGSLPHDQAEFIPKDAAITLTKQVHEVAERNEKLTKELTDEKKKNDSLLEENGRIKRQLKDAQSSSAGNIDTGKMFELLDWLDNNAKKSTFSNDLTISRDNLNSFISRMKSCIKTA